MIVNPIPSGYHSLTPYLAVRGAATLIDFLKQAFEAKEIHRLAMPDGTIMNAEIKIGDSMVMIGEVPPGQIPFLCQIYHYVADIDAVYKTALKAGATSIREPSDQFYGERNAAVKDPVGNSWWIATRKENLSPEEMAIRFEALMKQKRPGGN